MPSWAVAVAHRPWLLRVAVAAGRPPSTPQVHQAGDRVAHQAVALAGLVAGLAGHLVGELQAVPGGWEARLGEAGDQVGHHAAEVQEDLGVAVRHLLVAGEDHHAAAG